VKGPGPPPRTRPAPETMSHFPAAKRHAGETFNQPM
jgi:hypothetical protein